MSTTIVDFINTCNNFKAENGGFEQIISQSAKFIPDSKVVLADEFQVFPKTIERWAAGESIPNKFAQRGIVATIADIIGRQLEPERRQLKADGLASDPEVPRRTGLEP